MMVSMVICIESPLVPIYHQINGQMEGETEAPFIFLKEHGPEGYRDKDISSDMAGAKNRGSLIEGSMQILLRRLLNSHHVVKEKVSSLNLHQTIIDRIQKERLSLVGIRNLP